MDLLSTSVINARNSWPLELPEDGSLARLRRQRDGAQGAGAAQRGAGGGGRRLSGTQERSRYCSVSPCQAGGRGAGHHLLPRGGQGEEGRNSSPAQDGDGGSVRRDAGFHLHGPQHGVQGAIVARMIARGEIKAKGLLTPEQVIAGPVLDRLLTELVAVSVRLEETTEAVEAS